MHYFTHMADDLSLNTLSHIARQYLYTLETDVGYLLSTKFGSSKDVAIPELMPFSSVGLIDSHD